MWCKSPHQSEYKTRDKWKTTTEFHWSKVSGKHQCIPIKEISSKNVMYEKYYKSLNI